MAAIWKQIIAGVAGVMAICASAMAENKPPANTPPETDAKSVETRLTQMATELTAIKIRDPSALTDGPVHALINAAIGLVDQREKAKSLEQLQAGISRRLLMALITTPDKWTSGFAAELGAEVGEFSKALASYDVTLEFVRAATLLKEQVKTASNTAQSAVQAADALGAELESRFPASVLDAASTHSTALVAIMGEATKLRALHGNKAITENLAKLYNLTRAFAERDQNRVHVLGALYGDLAVIQSVLRGGRTVDAYQRRLCVATATVVKDCEREASCTVAPTGGYRTGICGYDPAPFLEDKHMALVVFYTCRSNLNEHNWTGRPGELTGMFDPRVSQRGTPAVLYSGNQSFSCKDAE